MNRPNDPAGGQDDFAAGWLLAWKAFLTAGAVVPDPAAVGLPPELAGRLRRGAACLRSLHEIWPPRPAAAPGRVGAIEALPPARVGRFEVVRELGRGGFGVVLLARDPLLGRDVAVKIPRPGAEPDPREGERLAIEAQAAARLDHSNIVP